MIVGGCRAADFYATSLLLTLHVGWMLRIVLVHFISGVLLLVISHVIYTGFR